MKIYADRLKSHNGYLEGGADAVDKETLAQAMEYKRDFLRRFVPIPPRQISSRLGEGLYWVTRKYDGEFADILYDGREAATINRSATVRSGIPCIDEAVAILRSKGISQAVIPAELYVHDPSRKTRVSDLLNALSDPGKLGTLRLACYDITQLDGKPFRAANYGETLEKLEELFGAGKLCHVVDWERVHTSVRIRELFRIWVEEEGSEGLVVRSEMPFVWKIKPRHNVDTVVVGFTEGTGNARGGVRTLLLAMMPAEGKYQIVTHAGGGMSIDTKRALYKYLLPRTMRSQYMDTDSNHVAFRMVEPDLVIEVSVNDVRWETPAGTVRNPVLEIVEGEYRLAETADGISFVAPVIERLRQDKRADASDTRLAQVEAFSSYEPTAPELIHRDKLRPSELLFREVYQKRVGSKIMVLKFTGWKTNKEGGGEWPAYVLHVTNFSSDRNDHLQREVNITDDYDQLFELLERAIDQNVRKGWVKVV